jgi:hypothetical protein
MRGGGDLVEPFRARAEAAVKEAAPAQGLKGALVGVHAPRLDEHRRVPGEAEPDQVLKDGGGELRPAAAGVDVFQAQQKLSTRGPGGVMGENCAEGVPAVQQPGGRGREAGDEGRWVQLASRRTWRA